MKKNKYNTSRGRPLKQFELKGRTKGLFLYKRHETILNELKINHNLNYSHIVQLLIDYFGHQLNEKLLKGEIK